MPLAAAFAAKLSRRKGRESTDPEGEACDVILDLVRRVDEGTFAFRGAARFSSYLYTIISDRARGKHYVPAAVKRLGKQALTAFRLIYLDGFDRRTASGIVASEFDVPSAQAFQLCKDVVIAAEQSIAQKGAHQEPLSLDVRMGDLPPLAEQIQSHYPDAEQKAMSEALSGQVNQMLAAMEPSQAELLRRLHMTSQTSSLRQVAEQLGLKSPSYSYKQALETFKAMLEMDGSNARKKEGG